MFSGDAHDHLISLLCTFEQFGIYHLIFPWAACDLNGFWQISKPKPSFDLKTVKWFAKQCEGIAHGLLKIQNFRTNSPPHLPSPDQNRYGRHGDLKPENILFFPDDEGGTLKISDFGLSDYSTASKSHLPKSRVATSMSYRPPECDIPKSVIGQSYDIWTLGCLYLEFITWLLGGWEFVKIFERERMSHDPMWYEMRTDTFFELVRIPSRSIAGMVKPKVTAVFHPYPI
jgi:serine/threonine protein kinase